MSIPVRAAAVILAAGRGGRMGGAAKAALLLPSGETFLARIAATARQAGCTKIVVVSAAPHAAATEAAALAAGCDAVLLNPAPELGMVSSLAAGLASLDRKDFDVALSWPVDHPTVGATTVAAILAAASRQSIVVPCHGGRGGHPTAFGIGLWDEVTAAVGLAGGARNVIDREASRVTRLAVSDAGVVLDIDTPEDYRRLTLQS